MTFVRVLSALLLVALLGGCRAQPSEPVPDKAEAAVLAPETDPAAAPSPTGPAAPTPAGEPPGGAPERVGGFDVAALPEASGLAASRRTPGILYAVDDGPGTTGVVVLAPDGTILGTLGIEGLLGIDTEGLAVGPCGPGTSASCLYVGDIGDNQGVREDVDVWRVEEPDLAAGVPMEPLPAAVARLRYPGGPVNSEALMVDEAGGPLLVSKADFDEDTATTGRTRLLGTPVFADATLVDLGEVPVPDPAIALAAGVVGNVVTAGDTGPGRVLLRTYDAVLEYRSPDPAAPLSTFPTWPVTELAGPFLPQAEAVAYTADGCGWATISEGVGDLWVTACG